MIPIFPLTEETIREYTGQPLVAITRDGRQHIGILSRVEKGRLIFNDQPETKVSKFEKSRRSAKRRARTSDTPPAADDTRPTGPAEEDAIPEAGMPVHPFGGKFVLELSSVSLLLLAVF
jgi:hypothetical protein